MKKFATFFVAFALLFSVPTLAQAYSMSDVSSVKVTALKHPLGGELANLAHWKISVSEGKLEACYLDSLGPDGALVLETAGGTNVQELATSCVLFSLTQAEIDAGTGKVFASGDGTDDPDNSIEWVSFQLIFKGSDTPGDPGSDTPGDPGDTSTGKPSVPKKVKTGSGDVTDFGLVGFGLLLTVAAVQVGRRK